MSDMYEGHIFSALNLAGRSVTLIVIDIFYPWNTHLDWIGTHSRRAILP
jgi:hypothetical protein